MAVFEQISQLTELGVRAAHTRLQLLQAELGAEKARVFSQATSLLMAVFFGIFGLFLAVLCLIYLTPVAWKPVIAGGGAVIFLALCALYVQRIRSHSAHDPLVLTTLLSVLERDLAQLRAKSGTSHSGGGE